MKSKEQIQWIPTEDPIPYDRNPRDNDGAVDAVAKSIEEFGFKQPLVLDENKVIIVGHTRLKAAKKLGLEQVPVIIAKDLDRDKVKAYRLADNKTGELATWNDELLMLELEDIDLSMESFGFEKTMNQLEEELIEDDLPEEDDLPPRTKPGEIWSIGNHRLMVGDSTNTEDVKKLMGGELADLVVTDPPYNVDYTGGTDEALKIENDSMSEKEFIGFLEKAFRNLKESLKPGGVFYIWHADAKRGSFLQALRNAGLDLRQILVWVKSSMVLGRQDYNWKHEPCLYGWKEGEAHYFSEDFTQSTVIEDAPRLSAMNKDQLKDYIKELREIIDQGSTIIREDKPSASLDHPTMKPIKLFGRHILHSSKPGEKVLDLFGGSGTTVIACEQLDRKAYVMEFDPHYADVILKRYENFTGYTAKKISE